MSKSITVTYQRGYTARVTQDWVVEVSEKQAEALLAMSDADRDQWITDNGSLEFQDHQAVDDWNLEGHITVRSAT